MPAKASTEPTDRSIPPEMITNVIPIATMALSAVCSSTLSRFETVRKCGVAAQRIAHSASRPANVPSCRPAWAPSRALRAARRLERLVPARRRWSCGHSERRLQDVGVGGLAARRARRTTRPPRITRMRSLMPEHFRQIGRDHDEARAVLDQAVHQQVDVLPGRHVDARASARRRSGCPPAPPATSPAPPSADCRRSGSARADRVPAYGSAGWRSPRPPRRVPSARSMTPSRGRARRGARSRRCARRDSGRTRPCCLRSSGRNPIRAAHRHRPANRCARGVPAIDDASARATGSAPTSARASRVRPAPTSPAMPRISPRRRTNEMSSRPPP